MKFLVACEESQAVCIAFRERGHEAYSCDLQRCSGGHPEWHIIEDVTRVLSGGYWDTQFGTRIYVERWDLMIAHPPCTYLSRVGIQHNKKPGRKELMDEAIELFLKLKNCEWIPKIAIENPVPQAYVTKKIGRWRQVIQPYYFGDGEMKTTCLWLKGLGRLNGNPEFKKPQPSGYNGRGNPYYWAGTLVSKKDRAKLRSKTFPSIAKKMAEQWG